MRQSEEERENCPLRGIKNLWGGGDRAGRWALGSRCPRGCRTSTLPHPKLGSRSLQESSHCTSMKPLGHARPLRKAQRREVPCPGWQQVMAEAAQATVKGGSDVQLHPHAQKDQEEMHPGIRVAGL